MQRTQMFVTSLVLLAACGDDGGNNVTILDGSGGGSDSAMVTCKASSSYGAVTPTTQEAHSAMTMDGPNYWVFLDLNADPTPDIMLVDLYGGFGVFEAGLPATGGAFQLTGDEVNPATCGACVSIQVDYTDMGPADDQYIADGGTLNLTSVTATSLAGNLSNVTFRHMNVDSSGIATPHPDGCTATLTSIAFSATPAPEAAATRSRFARAKRH